MPKRREKSNPPPNPHPASIKPPQNGEDEDVVVLYRTSLHNMIYEACKSRPGWKETDSDTDWDFNWADIGWIRDFYDHMSFEGHQRVNHFRNHYELTRKDLLIKNLKRMKRQFERTNMGVESRKFEFYPSTFVLPSEYGLFLEDFKRHPGSTWIMKPIGRAQGKGIFLFNKLSQISDWKKDHKWKADGPQAETYIAQRYIDNPYTVGGKKFDLRLYALVTSFTPLVLWIHRAGFCRFSSERYDEDQSNLDNTFIHLTNYSIQKKSADHTKNQDGKWDIQGLKLLLMSKHGRVAVEKLFDDIKSLIIHSLLSVQKTIIQDKHCFELYGYDVLIDQDLKPWLIEVNASPSLTPSSPADRSMKLGVMNDLLEVVDLEGNLTGDETGIGGFDLSWNGGPVDDPNTYIGCQYESVQHNTETRSTFGM